MAIKSRTETSKKLTPDTFQIDGFGKLQVRGAEVAEIAEHLAEEETPSGPVLNKIGPMVVPEG